MGIPTVDLSPFFRNGEDEEGLKKAKDMIKEACSDYGFFQIINHGVPLDLMSRAIQQSETFFSLPDEVKLQYRPRADAPVPLGYGKQPALGTDKNEFVMMLPPGNCFNVLPDNPPHFRSVAEELFRYLSRTGELVESIINDCLDLPPNFLKGYNEDRSMDLMTMKRYFPATESENVGISRHEDGNVITFIFQDGVGGLEVLKDDRWIPVVPPPGTIVVNVADVLQVLTNNKLKSATHRVTRQQGRSRHSVSFFYNLLGDKWVEPLPHFTTQIGKQPNYRGFLYKDYLAFRVRNKTHPPACPQHEINISYYAISTSPTL